MDDAFGHWFAGFVDGEGCFTITDHKPRRTMSCSFCIAVRIDDKPILVEICDTLGIGVIYEVKARGSANAAAEWRVVRKADLLALISILERYPLRAKKRFDFEIWRDAVCVWGRGGRGSHDPSRWGEMAALKAAMQLGRRLAPA